MIKKLVDNRRLFFLEVTTDGKKELVELGSNYPLALTRYYQIVDGIEKDKSTFASVSIKYFDEVVPKKAPRTQKDNFAEIANLLEFFGGFNISEIKPNHVKQYLTIRRANVRANREISLLSHIYNNARAWGFTDNENPCRGVQRNKEVSRDVYIDDELFNKIYAVASKELKNIMMLAYLTAQRPADVLKMKWADIYEEGGEKYLFVDQNKTKGMRLSLQIEGDLALLLKSLKKTDGQIIEMTVSQLRGAIRKARKLAGVKHQDFYFKDLRAKKITDVFNVAGIDAAQSLAGHTTPKTTRTYIRNKMGNKVRTKY